MNPFYLITFIFLFSYQVESLADPEKGREGYESSVESLSDEISKAPVENTPNCELKE